jgi:hypothetical protein
MCTGVGARIRGRDDTSQKLTLISPRQFLSSSLNSLQMAVLPSLVLLIDAFGIIVVMYLSVESHLSQPDTMVERRQSLIYFQATQPRPSGDVATYSPSPRP